MEHISKSLEEYTHSISKRFEVIRPWVTGTEMRERTTWVFITGVPVHSWKEDLFNVLAQLVGTPGHVDENPLKKKRLDVGRILISTSYPQAINRTVRVNINDMIHSIRFMEDIFSDPSSILVSKRVFRKVEDCSFDESDSVADNVTVVLETMMFGGQKISVVSLRRFQIQSWWSRSSRWGYKRAA